MAKAAIKDSIYWLNTLPSDNGEYDTLSPSEIVQGLPNPKYDKITIDFGSYAQVHTGNNNTNRSIKIVTIALQSDG